MVSAAAAAELVQVYDVWAQQDLGNFTASFTAKGVAHHGSALLRFRRPRSNSNSW